FLAAVVQRWRGAMMSHKHVSEDETGLDAIAAEEFGRLTSPAAPAPDHVGARLRVSAPTPESYAFPTASAQGQSSAPSAPGHPSPAMPAAPAAPVPPPAAPAQGHPLRASLLRRS